MNDYEPVGGLQRPSLPQRARHLFYAWWFTRSWHRLLYGLPFLAVTLLFACFFVFGVTSSDERIATYLDAAQRNANAGNHRQALVCFDAISYLGDKKPEILFGLAQAAEESGQKDRAIGLMASLASGEKAGYPEAHLWWAKKYLEQPERGAVSNATAERHLNFALDSENLKDRAAAEGMLGELCLETGRYPKAIEHLSKAVKAKPALGLKLAQAYKLTGQNKVAYAEAQGAVDYLRSWLNFQPNAVLPRLQLADALILLDDYPGAVALLKEGVDLGKDDRYRKAVARVYLSWAAQEANSPKPDVGKQFTHLQAALDSDPANVELLTMVWSLSKSGGTQAEKAISLLQNQLAAGNGSAMVHLALGMNAWDASDKQRALTHLEQAYRLSPRMPLVGNNLAWVLASANPPDLDRALGLASALVDRWPDDPTYRDTRAFVYSRMGRWNDALVDLQKALPRNSNNPAFHARLAEAYDKLGLAAIAAEHRRIANELAPKAQEKKWERN